ncbi:MAG: sirohydrochlorin chelatase [Candidatus Methanomethylophilaceae archaeon]
MDSILIVAHGNQSGDNGRTERQAEGLKGIIGLPVFCAYRRFSEDRVKVVMTRMAEQGLRDVLVIPMFMSANMYSDSIPKAMGLRDAGSCGTFREGDCELRYRITTTLGDWKGSADLVAGIADSYEEAGILLVCGCSDKGEPDPLVRRSMEIISSRGHNVEYCANTRDPEPGAEAIERMRIGGSERIVAIPVAMGATVRFPIEGAEISHSFGDDPGIPRVLADIVEAYDDTS